jgi:hypothetical protein
MFDFQVQQNCELVADIISNLEKRDRPWRA